MINIPQAIHKLYPQVTHIVGFDNPIAYDADGNEVSYDLQAVTAQAETEAQAVIDAKQSALSKLTALGLTEDEVKVILGVSA